jgi:hypothetical protein
MLLLLLLGPHSLSTLSLQGYYVYLYFYNIQQ